MRNISLSSSSFFSFHAPRQKKAPLHTLEKMASEKVSVTLQSAALYPTPLTRPWPFLLREKERVFFLTKEEEEKASEFFLSFLSLSLSLLLRNAE